MLKRCNVGTQENDVISRARPVNFFARNKFHTGRKIKNQLNTNLTVEQTQHSLTHACAHSCSAAFTAARICERTRAAEVEAASLVGDVVAESDCKASLGFATVLADVMLPLGI